MLSQNDIKDIQKSRMNFVARTIVASLLNLTAVIGVELAVQAVVEHFFPELPKYGKIAIIFLAGLSTEALTAKQIKRLVDKLLRADDYLTLEEIEEMLRQYENQEQPITIEAE